MGAHAHPITKKITKSSCFVCFRANSYKRYYNGRVQEKIYAPSNAHTIEYFSNG